MIVRRSIISWLITIGLGFSADAADQTLAQRIANANSSLTTVSGTFVQRTSRADDAGAEPRVLQATFALQFPRRYDVQFTRPDDDEWRQRLCSDGFQRWTIEQSFAGSPPDITVAPVRDDDPDVQRFFTYVRFDLPTLERNYYVAATAAEDGSHVTLTARTAVTAGGVDTATIVFDRSDHITSATFTDSQGNRTAITITTSSYGVPLAPERFRGPSDR